jgi:hypothetical protein
MTLLELIQTVTAELGLVQPSAVIGSSDLQVNQLLALANRSGTALMDYDWTDLQTQFIINVEAATETTGDVFEGSDIITNIPDTSALSDKFAISGNGMPQAQHVAEILSASSVRTQMESTATETGAALIFAKDTYDLPDDFDRYIGQTWWDRTNHWRLIGPDSPQQRQYIRSGIFATGPRVRWTQRGRKPGAWIMWPPPFDSGNTPDALVWEYISNGWVEHTHDGTTSSKFTGDSDEPLIDPQLIILDVKWRMWQIKGFEYAAMQQEFIDQMASRFGGDGGIPDLYLNRRSGPNLISSANVRDGDWPGPGNA